MSQATVSNLGQTKVMKMEDLKKLHEILIYILEMRYLTIDQVLKKFFDEGKVEPRVQRLFDDQFITSRDKVLEPSSLIRVTEKGYEQLLLHFPESKIPKREKNIFNPRVKHDLLLADLRIRFEELNYLKKWQPETMLKEIPLFLRAFKDLPDALCMKNNEKGYFLELEVSKKGPKQYRERIQEYLEHLKKEEFQQAQIEGVIFFCTNPDVVESIRKEIPKDAKGISVQPYYKYFPQESNANPPVVH